MRRDPVLAAVCLFGAAVIGWLLYGPGDDAAFVRLFWTALPVCDALLWYFSRHVARMRETPPDAVRFWRACSHVGLLFLAGDASQTVVAWWHPGPAAAVPNAFQAATILAGAAWMVWIMLTHPGRRLSRRARIRFWLDAASVLVGAGVLIWLLVLPARGAQSGGALVALLLGTSIVLVAGFAAVKLILSGNAPISLPAAAPMLLASVLQGGVGALVGPDGRHLRALLAVQFLSAVLVALGPRLQELCGPPAPLSQREAKPYSLLPYTSLAGMFAALPVVLRDGIGPDVWLLLGGLFAATVLAVSRQLLAFAENTALLRELSGQQERIRSLLAHSTDITSVVDAAGTLTFVSPATERLLGKSPDAVLGTPVISHIHPDDLPIFLPAMERLRAQAGATVTYQIRYAHADGTWRWLDVVSRNLLDVPGVQAYVSNARDATQARLLQDELRHQATHDGLTGLANRALFDQRLAGLQTHASVLLVDLNGFKAVNDTHGHHAGDAVLVAVAERLAAATPSTGTAARLGGDEFAVLLPAAGPATAAAVAEHFLALLDAPVLVDGHRLAVRAAVGIATGPPGDPDGLLRRADTEMYRRKRAVVG
ncbi:diguanylate cyclase domain-containing protein [Dactylosporangium salmoneum]|uniref:PAS domain S-box-containing protein/diguanylate cyclase (GGDEF)-like protein n=1 Tax=Dactylosporangium salmoneum TaxID=53361 RepID=A0ABP5V6M3_9ACTN